MKVKYSIFAVFIAIFLIFSACEEFPIYRIELDKTTLELEVGETYALEVIVIEPLSSAYANTITWSSSDNNVAMVDNNGVVTAVYSGSCEITAKAGHQSAVCKVTVGKLAFDINQLTTTKAKAFFWGDAYESGTNNFSLKIFNSSIDVSDQGDIGGVGYLLNIDLQVPVNETSILSGSYQADSLPKSLTFLQGDTMVRDNTTYAVGSYLYGLDNTGGTMFVFIKGGTVEITNGSVVCNLVGAKGEEITAKFSGNYATIDMTTPIPSLELAFTETLIAQLGNAYSPNYKVQRVDLYTANNEQLQLELTVPLSTTNFVPKGTYTLAKPTLETFGVVPPTLTADKKQLGSWLFENGTAIELTKGTVVVDLIDGKNAFSCHFIDKNGREIIGKN